MVLHIFKFELRGPEYVSIYKIAIFVLILISILGAK